MHFFDVGLKTMQLWLAATAPHGLTDIFSAPRLALQTHAASALLVAGIPDERLRIGLLIPFSIMHMRADYGGLWNSALVHAAWLACPPLAMTTLACYHTPLHYARTFPTIKPAHQPVAVALCVAASVLCASLPEVYEVFTCHAMWVAPVIAHIVVTEVREQRK